MNNQRKKLSVAVSLALAVGHAGGALAQAAERDEDRIEEIVTSAPFQQSEAQATLPVGILSGTALRERINDSLGATLKNEIGLANASFGPGAGHPVIRGQSGNRVKVLQNGLGITDASSVSPDHANAVNLTLADRLEVIRGPSALLYGSGAVGGIVNVIDNRIPESLPEEAVFVIQQSHDTVSSRNETRVRVDGAAGNLAFHLDAFASRNDNVEISGYAVDEEAVEALEALLREHREEDHDEEDHHDEHHHEEDEHEEFENTRGFIGNSDAESNGGNIGFSFVGDNGFFGVSMSKVEKDYGLPLGVHVHAHGEEEHEEHEEEHEEGHEEGDHEDDHDDHGHGEVEFVRIAMEKIRYDLKGEWRPDGGFVESIRATARFTDYVHDDIEFFKDGGRKVGIHYENDGTEGRVLLTHVPVGNWTGVWGLQFSDTVFSAAGEEAFIAKSDIDSTGIFAIERYAGANWTGELGIRFEDQGIDPEGRCEYGGDIMSLSGSVLYELGADDGNLLFGVSRSQRAPTVEELYSNISTDTCSRFDDDEDLVLHAATDLLEIGDPLLEEETSTNLEFGYRWFGDVAGEIGAYYNQVDNFIFLDLTGEEFEEQQIAGYFARDARFTGIEGEVSFNLRQGEDSSVALGLFGDMVNAEFDSGGHVPRIPAARMGAELRWFGDNWSIRLHAARAWEQEDVAELELPTAAYTSVSLYADYRWDVGDDSSLEVFLRGDNLLDEEIRNHVSMLKNYAPEPGRGVMAGVRFEY